MENKEVSSANILTSDSMFTGRSFININNNGPRTRAKMFSHVETCPFNTTVWSLSDRKSFNRDNKEPMIPYDCNLNINPSCQTLSKALEISRNI